MKAGIKNIILQVFIWLMLVAFLSVTMSFVVGKRNAVICTSAVINISEAQEFIDENEVKLILEKNNLFLPGIVCDSLNLDKIEKVLAKHNQVKSVESFLTVDGRLIINITQRIPLLRVFNRDNESFYIDEDGKLMRTSSRYTPRVPVVSGNVFGSIEKQKSCIPRDNDTCDFALLQLYQLYCLAGEIQRDSFMYSLVDQIYINQYSQIELLTKISDWTIVLGDTDRLNEKFNILKTFLCTVPYPDGWDRYKVINLSFKNQVVCTKKTEI